MLEPVFADVMKKALQLRNFDDASATKSIQRVTGESPFAAVTAYYARGIVGGNSCKGH